VNEAVRLAQSLVRIDTAGGGEQAAANLLAKRLARAGARVEVVPYDSGRAHLVAFAGDIGSAPLLLSGHLDTVPAGGQPWSRDPLSGEVAEGWLHGRGAADMKSGVAALVTAIERHLASGRAGRGFVLVLTAAEETGCEGARHLVQTLDLPRDGPLLVAEPTANRIATGHKGVLWLRISAAGSSAHGSRPDLGTSAITPLARLAVAMAECGIPDVHPVMGPVTTNVGTFSGGTRINLVPDAATMTVDVRMVPGVEPDDVVARLRELGGDALEIEVLENLPPAYCEPDGPFVRMVGQAQQAATGVSETCLPLTYFTDAAILTGALACPEVVLLGPGDPAAAHTTDERCDVSQIVDAEATYEQVLSRWSAGEG